MIILPRKIILSKNTSYGFRIIKKKKLSSYHSNDQDKIRRAYIQKKVIVSLLVTNSHKRTMMGCLLI